MNNNKFALLVMFCALSVSVSCGNKMTSDSARKVIADHLQIPEEKVEVKQVSEISGTVIADASLMLTFVLQKDQSGQYKILKIHYGDKWDSPERLQEQLPQSSFGRALHHAFLSELNPQ